VAENRRPHSVDDELAKAIAMSIIDKDFFAQFSFYADLHIIELNGCFIFIQL